MGRGGAGESSDIDPPRRESLQALRRRQRRSLGRHSGIQYWLRVRGYYILAAFTGLFVLNAVVIGGRVAYDVSIQIDSPWDTTSPLLALPLSIAGWLVVTGFAGAVAGYVVAEVTDNRNIRRLRGRSAVRRIGPIPLLDRLQYGRHSFEVPHYFGIRFALRHHGDWRTAQDHWEMAVEKFLNAEGTRGKGPKQVMWEAVLEASYVLDGMSGRCPECGHRVAGADRKARHSLSDVTRQLHVAAYPDKDPDWIDHQVATAEARISQAKQSQPSTAAGARRLSDAVINRAGPARRTTRQRVVLTAGLAVVAVALGITERQWVAEAAISTVGIGGLLAAAAVTSVGTIASYVRSHRERILSCRVRIDAPFGVDIGETVRLEGERHAVADPGVVVVRIKNTGGTPVDPEDYVSPLSLHFPGRQVVSVDATEFEPAELQRVLTSLPEFTIERDRVMLPAIGLKPGHSFKLVIVLSGTKPGEKHQVAVEGGLRDGRITTREGKQNVRPATLMWGGLTAICAGAFAVVLLLNNVTPFARLPSGVVCVPGSLTLEGSTAFARAATELVGSYGAYCPEATIQVRTPGSREGLERLVDDGSQRLALSDGRFDDPQFRSLVPEPLAIAPFTVVASRNVPVDSLSVRDARLIFTGAARVWSDITGNPRDTAEIRIVGRSTDSGTRQALEQHVLSSTPGTRVGQADATSDSCRERLAGVSPRLPIVCERGSTGDLLDRLAHLDDAIGYADVSDADQATDVKKINLDGHAATLDSIRDNNYPFWTVEYVYSHGRPEPGSLPDAFKNFLLTAEGRSTMAGFQYYACVGDVNALCDLR
jgi:phosphate transport system substrate-binding protein